MKLATIRNDDGTATVAIVDGDEVVDVGRVDGAPATMLAVLEGGTGAMQALTAAARSAARRPLAAVSLAPPVPRPPKLLAIGLNYAEHAAESDTPKPPHQLWFNKQVTCVIATGDPIHIPRASSVVDYEGELAFVIGRRCRHVPRERAREVIAGFTIINDVSVRDWQRQTPTMMMGKSFDTHGPLGPWVVTSDELGDPHDLRLRTWVNGDLRQDASTADMIADCYDQIAHLTTAFTLEPGDVIATGTPAGVGIAMDPPGLLSAGDVVRIEIEGIGSLVNPVIDEPSDTATHLG
jgi:2-keto-4-pentenoate hydratase/2-oxohepta-3-ene-1,7-dioic acid hydratase in catechol pathway